MFALYLKHEVRNQIKANKQLKSYFSQGNSLWLFRRLYLCFMFIYLIYVVIFLFSAVKKYKMLFSCPWESNCKSDQKSVWKQNIIFSISHEVWWNWSC